MDGVRGAQYIYNDKSRFLYDFWGPVQAEMSLRETLCNTGLFYLLWTFIMYAVGFCIIPGRKLPWPLTCLLLCCAVVSNDSGEATR